ncbi:hypothetical protein [Secundilactobacillus similis]|uniref:hypothetical protein n=1 Tax=Secundilactobacillus similis TaxID=414682 RepID=UPI0006D059E4|nr:hypothetical protein [Secundilactobacillus similis]
METIQEQLLSAQQTGRLVSLFRYGDERHFLTGNVIAVDEKFGLIKRINQNGAVDGLIVLRLNTITKVIAQSDYLKSLVAIMALARERHYSDVWQIDAITTDLDLAHHSVLKATLKWAFKQDQVVSLGIHPGKREKTYTGFIAALKNKSCNLTMLMLPI